MRYRRSRRFSVVLLLSLLLGSVVFAQEKRPLTLEEAIQLSIRNSKQLKGSAARIAEATAVLRQARDRQLPDATVSSSYLRLNKPHINMKTKSSSSGSSGGASSTPQSGASPNSAAYVLANVSVPLYSGFRIKYGIESAKYLEQATILDAEDSKEELIANTMDAYNNLFKARSAVSLVNENLQSAKQRVKELSDLEKNGLLARNDLLKAQLQQSNTELALLDAENNWQLSTVNMNLMLGLPENTELILDSASLQKIAPLKTIDEYVQAGLQNRKDLAALGYRKKAAITGIKAAQGEKYPGIAVSGGYVAMDVPHLLTVTNAVNIGLGIRYDLGSLWKNKAKVQQAQARANEVEAGEEQLTDAIRLQVHQRYLNYLSSQKKIEVNAGAVNQAAENFRVIKNKYENSLATTTELLDADAALLQTKLNYSFSQSDAVVAYHKLLQAAGLLTAPTK